MGQLVKAAAGAAVLSSFPTPGRSLIWTRVSDIGYLARDRAGASPRGRDWSEERGWGRFPARVAMLFNSWPFLVFFVVTFTVYYLIPCLGGGVGMQVRPRIRELRA